MSKAADAGNSFLRLAAPLLDILRQASTTAVGGDMHPSLREGWMAVKTAIADAQEEQPNSFSTECTTDANNNFLDKN